MRVACGLPVAHEMSGEALAFLEEVLLRHILAAAAVLGLVVAAPAAYAAKPQQKQKKKFTGHSQRGAATEPLCANFSGDPALGTEFGAYISSSGNVWAISNRNVPGYPGYPVDLPIYIGNFNWEGYVVEDDAPFAAFDVIGDDDFAAAYSYNADSGNWDTPVASGGCLAFPTEPKKAFSGLKIVRNTVPARYSLTMKFALDKKNHMLTITHVLKNTSGVDLTGVKFARMFDGDLGGDFADDFYATANDGSGGVDSDPVGNGLFIFDTNNTKSVPHHAGSQLWDDIINGNQAGDLTTDPGTQGVLAGPDDLGGRVVYDIGTLLKNKTVTFYAQYRLY
jgi:hypothetical protein